MIDECYGSLCSLPCYACAAPRLVLRLLLLCRTPSVLQAASLSSALSVFCSSDDQLLVLSVSHDPHASRMRRFDS